MTRLDVQLPGLQDPTPSVKRTVSSATEALIEAFSLRQRQDVAIPDPSVTTSPPHHASTIYTAGASAMPSEDILIKRRQQLGPNMALFFDQEPLHVVKGRGCELFDADSTDSYLDCINNVSHVGHCHPRVAAAVSQQIFTLNTNSRYLHEGLATLAERLAATAPAPLSVVYPVVSGSEANDLAWRIACAAAKSKYQKHASEGKKSTRNVDQRGAAALHVCCVDHGYHGHTSTIIEISPYKFWGPGGQGKALHVHVLPCPDVYRQKNLDGAAAAREAIAAATASGAHIAAFFCESVISCGGQVVLPPGWLKDVYAEMRAAGAVCVADEVQCGFGRVGAPYFWAFETQAVVPDIITCGKPMGNGFPCAAVITTPALAAAFSHGMEFFATYGGCTAAAAAALAVLDVLRDEKLQAHAVEVGKYAQDALVRLQKEYKSIIGDVRGIGLMIGVELVSDEESKTPAPATAAFVKARCKSAHRVLLSTEGPYSNVIKIKPPMCFSRSDVDRMVAAVAEALGTVAGLDTDAAGCLRERNDEAVKAVDSRREALGAYHI